jgi:hypothetical protein
MTKDETNTTKQNTEEEFPFKQMKMVDWYSPSQLLDTAVKLVISSVFGDYADKREMQAALTRDQNELKPFDYSDREDIWIDYVADIGSGWDSTYSVAYLLGRKELSVKNEGSGKTYNLKRGNILVMGGDEVYPVATPEEYQNRLVGPYTSSLPYVDENDDPPTLFATPGNHDWYDGLSSFIKLFCQQRWIGGWQTRQTRSYFAAKLPHNWWLWAIDIQLNADIDKPQIDYFDEMCKLASKGDRVILCTAEPVWVYQEYQPDDKPYRNLKFFTNRYTEKGDKKLDIRLMLTGDMHHYTSFRNAENENPDWKITAGGGGAFTHPTHQVPDELNLEGGKYAKSEFFPDRKESHRMALNNLKFPFINIRFGVLFGIVYMLFGWFVGTSKSLSGSGSDSFIYIFLETGAINIAQAFHLFGALFMGSPGLSLILAFLFFGFLAFADTKRKKPLSSWISGIIHSTIQTVLILVSVWLTFSVIFGALEFSVNSLAGIVLSALMLALCGWLFSGFAMGIYLMTVTLLLKTHETEAFSSFRGENYRNFVRLHLDREKLSVYPVKIPKAYKNWEKAKKRDHKGDPIFVLKPGEDLEHGLIETPITIR